MSPQPETRNSGPTSRIIIKITVTLVIGGVAYLLSNLYDQPRIWGITLSAFIGGVTLIVQFLIDFDNRLQSLENCQIEHTARMEETVDAGFSKINEATELFGLVEASTLQTDVVTQLVRYCTHMNSGTPKLVYDFAHSEIIRISDFIKDLSEGADVTYDGEDRDWLLGLTHNADMTIDATSLTTVDAGTHGFIDNGLWVSELGQRYLEAQRDAVQRGVQIRRIFITDRPDLADATDLHRVCQLHRDLGINVRILDPPAIPGTRRTTLFDFILFDNVVSYEVTPASRIGNDARPLVVSTRLILRPERVRERVQRFKDLWDSANDLD